MRGGFEFGRGQPGEVGSGLLDAGERLREAAACQALPTASVLVAVDFGLQPAGAAAQDDLRARGGRKAAVALSGGTIGYSRLY